MSVILKLDSLTKDQVKMIQDFLIIIPIDPNEEKYRKNPFMPKIPSKPKTPVLMFKTEEDDYLVRLPYRFACSLTNSIHNHDLPYIGYIRSGIPGFDVTLRELQVPIVEKAYSQLVDYSTTTLGVPPGIGKCLDPDTPILMYSGNILKAKEIIVGDVLVGDNGEKRNVLSTCFGTDMMYEIIPLKGRSFKCNEPHVLTLVGPAPKLVDNNVNYTIMGEEVSKEFKTENEAIRFINNLSFDIFDIPLNEYLKRNENYKKSMKIFHISVEYPKKPVPNPYNQGKYGMKDSSLELILNSKSVRLEYLAGIIETFGSVKNDIVIINYHKIYERLALSLGFMAYPHGNKLAIEGLFSTIPTRNFKFPEDIVNATHQPFLVRKLGIGDYFGFTLDDNHRFLLGDYKVTHNTIMGALLAHRFGFITMVYCNRQQIAKQWFKTFAKCHVGYESWIWYVGETPPPKEGSIPPFIICMDKRYKSVPEYIIKSVGTLIIDEAHLFCTPSQVEYLLKCSPRYIIAETATLVRDDGMHSMIQSIVGTHGIFMVSEEPYDFYSIKTGIEVDLVKNSFGTNYDLLCKSLAANEERNNMIVNIVKNNLHRKFIILTRLTDHVEILERIFIATGISAGTLYGSKNTYSDSPVLIGTMPKMGTGFDEENACDNFRGKKSSVLILAMSVKKWQQYEQFRGRAMRSKYPIVIWLNDSNNTTKRHLGELKEWIVKTKGNIISQKYIADQFILPEED